MQFDSGLRWEEGEIKKQYSNWILSNGFRDYYILFSVDEFAEICWSLFLFGEDLIDKLNAFGVQNGFLAAPQAVQST